MDRDRPDVKESVRKLPMIGKMPLYKRPVIAKDKPESDEKTLNVEVPPSAVTTIGLVQDSASLQQIDENSAAMFKSTTNPTAHYDSQGGFDQHPVGEYGSVPTMSEYGSVNTELQEGIADYSHSTVSDLIVVGGEQKEKDNEAPAALPDDLQQALDIIYSANAGGNLQKSSTFPQPVPPPSGGDIGDTSGISVYNF